MSIGQSDVVVHVANSLDAEQRARLLERLRAELGVSRVRADPHTEAFESAHLEREEA